MHGMRSLRKRQNPGTLVQGRARTILRTGHSGVIAIHLTYPLYLTRIALDVAATQIQHVKINATNDDRTYIESGLINCLTVEANIDQTGMQFIQDIVYSMFRCCR